MRITNIDTLSALIDRLITERIKYFFFNKEGNTKKTAHQEIVIHEIKSKLINLFEEVYNNKEYNYISENRTFTSSNIIENIDELITNDIHIGESDRARLKAVMMEEKRLCKSNEGRAFNKNKIDKEFSKIVKK